jgi:predicted Zn finger-like uncharacterized protein
MRLTCPNCGAQYEVPDEVIPETGRDVQCSNCGDTWFQHHPDHMPEPARAEDALHEETSDAEAEYEPEYEPEPEPEYEPEPEPEQDLQPEPEAEAEPEPTDEEAEPPRRELDSSVRDILREEAEREEKARATENAAGLETQPDLGLDSQTEDQRTREAKARMARLRGESEAATEEPPEAEPERRIDPDSRSNLLPDIDEINSSLDAAPQRREDMSVEDAELAQSAQQGGGFRRGFLWSVLLFVILTLVYLFAPEIAGLSPQLEGPMATYVELVNALRAWVQETVASLLA